MKTLTHRQPTIALLIAIFAVSVLFAPSTAEAKYVDKSGDLPGFANITPVLIVGGVLIAGTVAYMIFKPKSDDAGVAPKGLPADGDASVAEEKETTSTDSDDAAEIETEEATISLQGATEQSRLGMFLNITDDRPMYDASKKTLDFSDMTVRAGITIGF